MTVHVAPPFRNDRRPIVGDGIFFPTHQPHPSEQPGPRQVPGDFFEWEKSKLDPSLRLH
jgi:hypothetical protein